MNPASGAQRAECEQLGEKSVGLHAPAAGGPVPEGLSSPLDEIDVIPEAVDVDSFPGSASALAGMRGSAMEKKMPARAPALLGRDPGTVSIDDPWYNTITISS